MATVEEILARAQLLTGEEAYTADTSYPVYTVYSDTEYVQVIDKQIPDFSSQISVRGEENSQFIGFQLPRREDGVDLTNMRLYIHYQTDAGGSDGMPCNVAVSDNYIRLHWLIPAAAAQSAGTVHMMIYAMGTNEKGEPYKWLSLPANYTIRESLDIGGGIPAPDQSWYEQFIWQMDQKISQAQAQADTAKGYADNAAASKTASAQSASAAAASAQAAATTLTTAKGEITEATAAAKNEIAQKATDTLATIPEEYTQIDADVKQLKTEAVRYPARFSNALVGTAAGTGSVRIDDAWEAPVVDLEVGGKTEQIVTTGAQLFDRNDLTTNRPVSLRLADEATIYLYATYSNVDTTVQASIDIGTIAGKKICLSGKSNNGIITCSFIDANDRKVWGDGSPTGEFIQIPTDAKAFDIYLRISNITDATIENPAMAIFKDVMIAISDTLLPFEPYTGGRPSPSPDFPQNIIGVWPVASGEQLLDNENAEYTLNGGSVNGFSKTNQGVKFTTAVRTASAGVYIAGFLRAGGKHSFSCDITVSSLEFSFIIINIGGSFTRISVDNFTVNVPIHISGTVIATNNSNSFGLSVDCSNQDPGMTVEFANIMISRTDTPLSWEPYTGGAPFLLQESPQPLDVTATGAQLFDRSQLQVSPISSTLDLTDDSTIIMSGTNPNMRAYMSLEAKEIAGKTICVSFEGTGGYVEFMTIKGTSGVIHQCRSPKEIIQVPADTDSVNITLYLANRSEIVEGTACSATYRNLMINYGESPLPWEPYRTPQTATIPLTAPLYAIGDVRDRIELKDGVWGIERNIQMHKLSADRVKANSGGVNTDNQIIDGRYTAIYCTDYADQIKKSIYGSSNQTQGFCNIAPPGKIIEWNIASGGKENIYTINLSSYIYITIPISVLGITTSATPEEVDAAVKQYVADNDVYVMFIAIPTWEPFPADIQLQLNALSTYSGQTNITISTAGLAPDLAVDYVQDIQMVIVDLRSEIEKLKNGTT